MTINKATQSKRRGSAVVLVTIAVVLLSLVGVGLLQAGLGSRLLAITAVHKIKACSAADAGLTMAIYQMNEKLNDKPWDNGSLPEATDSPLPCCDGLYSYTVAGDLGNGYSITCIGESGEAKRTVKTTVELRGLFDSAILTKANLILKSGTLIDGYNSRDPLDKNTDADIATQSTADSSITLNSGVVVNGDVKVGLGGNPDTAIKDLGATIAGSKYGAPQNDPLPQITAPAGLFYMGTSIAAKGSTVTISPADNGTYTGIDLKSTGQPGVLEIDGGAVELHITGDVELGESCEIVVKDGSSLTIYADGDIHCRQGSGINVENPAKEAETLTLYATGQDAQSFDIKANSEWIGVIYAPNADVALYANGDVYGSVTANNFEFKAGGNYHYDNALKKVTIDDEAVRFVIKRWKEQ
jgi:choice-of-anchor A domain-containing protein